MKFAQGTCLMTSLTLAQIAILSQATASSKPRGWVVPEPVLNLHMAIYHQREYFELQDARDLAKDKEIS